MASSAELTKACGEPVKHGVIMNQCGMPTYWWLGESLSREDFNDQLDRTREALAGEIEALANGMDLAAKINIGKLELAKIETVEEIMKLPLCASCKELIGG